MSQEHWDLLGRMATGGGADVAAVCRELVQVLSAERLFCVVTTQDATHVMAVDCDGYLLAYAEQRLREGQLDDLVFHPGSVLRGVELGHPLVTRRVSRSSRRTAVAATLWVAPRWALTLILDNRFAGESLATVDDLEVVRWLTLVTLAVRLAGGPEVAVFPPSAPPAPDPDAESGSDASPRGRGSPHSVRDAEGKPPTGPWVDSGELSDSQPGMPLSRAAEPMHKHTDDSETLVTVSALEQQSWNISRAARALGMTRHGLKKRMRRLGIQKTDRAVA